MPQSKQRETAKLKRAALERLIDSSPAVHFVVKASGDYGATFISEGIKDQLGYEPDQFTQDPGFWVSHIHPDDQSRAVTHVEEIFQNDGCVLEYRFQHADGSWRWMHDELALVRDRDGNPLEIIGSWLDITERVQAEEQLRLSEARLNEAQRLSKIGNWERDFTTKETWWSDECYRLLGLNPQTSAPSYEAFLERVHPDDRQLMRSTVERAAQETGGYTSEIRIVLPDGEVKMMFDQAEVIFDEEGQPRRLIGTAQDITERKRADENLRDSINRFELAVRATNDGIWDWNIQTGEDYFSPRWKEILGYREEELSPTIDTFSDLLHPDDSDGTWAAVEAHLTHKIPYDIEIRMRHKSGKFVWVRARGQATWDDAGEPLRMAGSISDITAQRMAEEEVIVIGERERSRIGHDLHDGLGQELTAISLGLKALAQQIAVGQLPDLQTVQGLTVMTQKTISATRQIARSLSPGFASELGISDALRALTNEVNEHSGVKCRVQCSDENDVLDPEVATHLYRIAQEGINNALKHSGAQNIELCFGRDGNSLFLELLDDGVGIPPEQNRAKGLGLRNMRYRAGMLHARLEVTRRTNGGTRVLCSCPYQPR